MEMKETFCDVRGCHKPAVKEGIDVCSGWLESRGSVGNFKAERFKPFEKPTIVKRDLCEKHFMAWCRATYEALIK